MTQKNWQSLIKVVVFFICLTPFGLLSFDAFNNNLGANPIETLHFRLGDWALRFLCICLSMTPIKIITKWNWPIRYRRLFGLYSFFYAAMHFLVYIALDLSFSWEQFVDEIPKSPYIIIGLFTFSILLMLALTSTKSAQRRLKKNWKRLHRLVYLAGVTAVIPEQMPVFNRRGTTAGTLQVTLQNGSGQRTVQMNRIGRVSES